MNLDELVEFEHFWEIVDSVESTGDHSIHLEDYNGSGYIKFRFWGDSVVGGEEFKTYTELPDLLTNLLTTYGVFRD